MTKSFRVDKDVIRKIEQEARNNNTSLNAEINSILRKYVDSDMLASKIGMCNYYFQKCEKDQNFA